MYRISEHIDDIITSFVSNIIWYILGAIIAQVLLWVPFILDLHKKMNDEKYNIPLYDFILIVISIFLMILLIALCIVIIIKSNKKIENEIITTDLIFNNLEIELYFKNRNEIVCNLTYDCIVNKEGVSDFRKSIIWTGSSYNYTKIIESNGQYDISDSDRKSSPYLYIINFNKLLSIGDNLYFKLMTSVNDDDSSMMPVFSHMVKQQTFNFSIQLTVPKNLVKNVRPAVYKDITRTVKVNNDIKLLKKNVGDLIQYYYTIENPGLLNNYCIEWDFIK